MAKKLSTIILDRISSGEIATLHDQEETRRMYLGLKKHHDLMLESASQYRDLHLQSVTRLIRLERKLRLAISHVRSRTGTRGTELIDSSFPRLLNLLRDSRAAFRVFESSSIGDLTDAVTWSKFEHPEGQILINRSDSPATNIRRLTEKPIVSRGLVDLLIGKTSALIGECHRLDDILHLTEDARYETRRMYRYFKYGLAKIISREDHYGKKRFQCARCCLSRDLKKILDLFEKTRPHWVSPESRQSLRYCDPRVYYL